MKSPSGHNNHGNRKPLVDSDGFITPIKSVRPQITTSTDKNDVRKDTQRSSTTKKFKNFFRYVNQAVSPGFKALSSHYRANDQTVATPRQSKNFNKENRSPIPFTQRQPANENNLQMTASTNHGSSQVVTPDVISKGSKGSKGSKDRRVLGAIDNLQTPQRKTPKKSLSKSNNSRGFASITPATDRPKSSYKIQNSPEKRPVLDDYRRHHDTYVDENLIGGYSEGKADLMQKFFRFISESIGKPFDPALFSIAKNTVSQPYHLLSINTHSTFCDRNTAANYQSVEGFVNVLAQCCSLVTRREGMSLIFLRNPSKVSQVGYKDRNVYFRSSNPDPTNAVFCVDCAPPWINTICESIESIYVSIPKGTYPNKSLVVNTGFFTVEGDLADNQRSKTMAVITANGIYDVEKARAVMQRIEAAIKAVNPDISVMIVGMDEVPKVKLTGTLEHCETVFADLIQGTSNTNDVSRLEDRLTGDYSGRFSRVSSMSDGAYSDGVTDSEGHSIVSLDQRFKEVDESSDSGSSLSDSQGSPTSVSLSSPTLGHRSSLQLLANRFHENDIENQNQLSVLKQNSESVKQSHKQSNNENQSNQNNCRDDGRGGEELDL